MRDLLKSVVIGATLVFESSFASEISLTVCLEFYSIRDSSS